jgi:hypothetical protein
MRILRGTFRLSLVLSGLMAIWVAIGAHSAALKHSNERHRLWATLRCGEKVLGKDVGAITNEFGNMDLSKVGCASKPFFARADEIEKALREESPTDSEYSLNFWNNLQSEFGIVVVTFMLTNVVGVLMMLLTSVSKWVWAGYKT